MPVPPTISNGLAEYWPFDEGSGSIAHGRRNQMHLALSASRYRGALGLDGLWHAPATPNQWAGVAAGAFPMDWGVLLNPGDAVTIGVEHWYGGYPQTRDPGVEADYLGGSCTLAWIDHGSGAADVNVSYAPHAPPPSSFPDTDIYFPSVLGNGADVFVHAPPFANTAGAQANYLAFVEVVRESNADVTVTLYIGGRVWQLPYRYGFVADMVTHLRLGQTHAPGLRRAAIWLRTLTTGERGGLFDEGGLGPVDPDVDPPAPDPVVLVDDAGASVFHPDWVVPMATGMGVVASDDQPFGVRAFRETRRVHEQLPRVYELRVPLARRAEVEFLRAAFDAARGGAGIVRWRHPKDDPKGTQADAPRYRFRGALRVDRGDGGTTGALVVVLERV